MKSANNFIQFLMLLLIVIVTFTLSCSIGNEQKRVLAGMDNSVALFCFFKYEANDSFYKENPLPSRSFYYNPILPGWYSDPSVCSNGEDYFLVTSTFAYFPGVPLFHSKDLVNWTQIGHVLNRPSQLLNMEGQGVSGGIFAPTIEYNPHNQTYYMITTNVGLGNFFVKTKDPFAQWSDPILLPQVGGIDPSFFFDEDGRAYIVNNDEPNGEPEYNGHRTIMIQEFDVNSDQTIGPRKIIVDKGARPEEMPIWIEGPHLYKMNNKYYLMAAEGGTGGGHSEVIFSSDEPMGNYRAWEKNPILTQRHLNPERSRPITNAGHADLIQTKEGDWWAFFLACRPIDNMFENLGRETFMMPVRWSEDGYPYITQADDLIPMIGKREGVTRSDQTTFGNFEIYDQFNQPLLNNDWLTLRTPATDLYSLTDTPGYLTLKCAPVSATEKKTPAYVGRRIQHHSFVCSTRMLFKPSGNDARAGMLLFKDEQHQYFFGVKAKDDKKMITVMQVDGEEKNDLVTKEIEYNINDIEMKVVSNGLTYDFYYALKPYKWQLLCKNIDASHLSTRNAGGFTGTTIGMYATTNL